MIIRSNQLEEKKKVDKEENKVNLSIKDFNSKLKELPTDLKTIIFKMSDFPKVRDPVYEKTVVPL
jgi:hypothetical protein